VVLVVRLPLRADVARLLTSCAVTVPSGGAFDLSFRGAGPSPSDTGRLPIRSHMFQGRLGSVLPMMFFRVERGALRL
jgi:hypothetical protein